MTIDVARIRAFAEAATDGPWFGPRVTDAWPPGEYGVYVADDHGDPIPFAIIARMDRPADGSPDEQCANATFIAAANPRVVIELLDAIEGAGAPEAHWECQQKIDALEEKLAATTNALTEALDLFDASWCPEHGHAPRADQLSRAEALRKMVQA